jgi:DNA modification methylase
MRISRDELLNSLRTCHPSVAKAGNRAVELTHFWFDGEFVSGYNGRLAIFSPVNLPINGGVQDTLLTWLDKTTGSDVEITVDSAKMTVQVGSARAHFPLLEANRQVLKYAEVIELLPDKCADLEKDIIEQLLHVLISLDARSAVPARMGAFFVPNSNTLDIYATDDNTISWLSVDLPDGLEISPYIVVPTGFLEQLPKMLPPDDARNDESLAFYMNDGMVMAVNMATMVHVVGNLVDCPNMPDFVGELTEFKNDERGVVVPEDLKTALDRILLIQNSAVVFEVRDKELHIQSERNDKDIGRLYERVVLPEHPAVDTYYDPDLVQRALKDRTSLLIGRNAMCLKGPENFLHLIAASPARQRMTIRIEHGDSRDILKTLPSDSVDSCVTDPPYSLVSIQKRFGKPGSAEAKHGVDGLYRRASAGFMGQQWDTGEVAFDKEFWVEVYRVLKPGAYLLAFGGTRTYHRLAVAIEDAGFEIRDALQWLYGSGFPKSHNVSKGIDAKLSFGKSNSTALSESEKSRVKIGEVKRSVSNNRVASNEGKHGGQANRERFHNTEIAVIPVTTGITDEAKQWEGWGTALKPACEIICLARKPLSESSVAANVLRWGTGALNVDACRIPTNDETFHVPQSDPANRTGVVGLSLQAPGGAERNKAAQRDSTERTQTLGRWPANVCHDGSEEVTEAFPYNKSGIETNPRGTGGIWSPSMGLPCGPQYGDEGSVSRFFYTSKADEHDRFGSKHPTVKPVDLIRWLVRLVTPPGGTVLDPFAGSGTTGAAAMIEDCNAILIEREESYVTNILDRIEWLETDDRYKIFQNAEDKTQIRSEIASVKNAPKSGWWKD